VGSYLNDREVKRAQYVSLEVWEQGNLADAEADLIYHASRRPHQQAQRLQGRAREKVLELGFW